MKKQFVFILIIACFLLLFSCNKQKTEWKGTIEEKDGVILVKNPDEPIYEENVFVLEEELSIGESVGREEYMFSGVQSVTIDDEGRIYVLDHIEYNVKIYDKNGKYINKFGKQGQGPGEFFLPRGVFISNQDEIIVQNYISFDFFAFDGQFKRSISSAEYRLTTSDLDSDGNIISTEIVRDDENPRYELRKFDPEMNYLHSFGSSPLPNSSRDGFNPLFPIFRWDLINGNQIVFGYMEDYELKIFDSEGKLIRKILKDYDRIKVTQKDIDERLEGEELPP
ncbi:MAG: 6-bladed beta-propeller, partial [Candidatus Aminicenantes bacterium]|nr:6-bladed beta-propeller [Candidatus Aminicenantes bacterium]